MDPSIMDPAGSLLLGERRRSLASPATLTRNWAKSNGFTDDDPLVAGGAVVVVVVAAVVVVDDDELLFAAVVDEEPPMVNLTVNSGGSLTGGVMVDLLMRIRPLELALELPLDPTGM